MIQPLDRGVDPAQLAFQALVTMGARTQRTAAPLAVALEDLGVDLARGERLTTAEARQFVSLIRATLEVVVVETFDRPVYRTGALLDTAGLAARELERALTDLLVQHRDFTTSLAPVRRELLVAVRGTAAVAPGPQSPVPAASRPPSAACQPVPVHEPLPTLAGVVRALVESAARLQAILPIEAAPRAPLPEATTRLLQSLVEAVAEVLTLLPQRAGAIPTPALERLARALDEAVNHLNRALAVIPAHTSGQSGSGPPLPVLATVESTPLSRLARLGGSVGQVVGLVHELLQSGPLPDLAANATPGAAQLPLPLLASLAEVIAHLTTALPAAVLEAADEAAQTPLGPLLAQLQAATGTNPATDGGPAVAVSTLETFDAYRWGLLVALNYTPAVGRASRALVSASRPRCAVCDRLLEQASSGTLVCPACR